MTLAATSPRRTVQKVTPPPGGSGGTPATAFNINAIPSIDTVTRGNIIDGVTQVGNLASQSGIYSGIDVPLTFTHSGTTYHGGYSILTGSALGASPAGGRPACFMFASNQVSGKKAECRFTTTATDASQVSSTGNGIRALGNAAGWYMIWPWAYQCTIDSGYYFLYDQFHVSYYRAIIADLVANHGVNANRVTAYGSSAGGRLSGFMAAHMPDAISGAVMNGGAIHGPGLSATVPADHITTPGQAVAIMYSFATAAWAMDGNPAENYSVHITPTHTALTAADINVITALPNAAQVFYASQHVGELWAYWNGAGNGLKTRAAQSVTVGSGARTATGSLYQWEVNPGTPTVGDTSVYVLTGSHGIEPYIEEDGTAYAFLAARLRA